MNYKLDNIPLSAFGALPGQRNQYFALEGMLDLPRRIGATEHNWGTSIEPFVQAEDIQLDGRLLILTAIVKQDRLDEYKQACLSCRTLSFEHDTFSVVCRDAITVSSIDEYNQVVARFWQNDFQLKQIAIAPSSSGAYRIDNFDLKKDFGIFIERSNSLNDTAARIEVNTTEFYTRTDYRGFRNITLNCSITGSSFADVYEKMQQFHSVLMQPGLRTLTVRNNTLDVYFKDGIAVRIPTPTILKFTLNMISVQ